MSSTRQERITFILKLIVGFALMFFIFSKIEWNDFISTIARINPIFIYIPIILFFFPGVWLSVLKWKKLLLIYNINLSFKGLYLCYLIGTFFNNFLPTTVGGDVSRVIYLKRITNQPFKIAASIIMERLTGLIALVVLNVCILILNLSFVFKYSLFLYLSTFIFLIVIILLLFFKYRNNIFPKHFLRFGFFSPLKEKIIKLSDAIDCYQHHKKILVAAFLISIIFVLLGVFSTYLYFLSIAIKVPILKLILIYTSVQLAGLLPISINSLGVKEGLFIVLFGLIEINSVDALTVALLGRVLMILVSLSGGIVFIFRKELIK